MKMNLFHHCRFVILVYCVLLKRERMKPTFSGHITFQMKVLAHEKRSLYMPILDALVMNMCSEDLGVTEKFFVDTGAAFSVLRGKYEELFKQAKPVDTIKVQYGSEDIKHLPVYDAKLKVKNIEAISLKIAIDRNLKTPSLLGNVDFIDRFKSIALLNHTRKVHFFF